MDPAYYVAAGSLKARSFHLETISNNMANTATVGYKTERSFFATFNKAKNSVRSLPLTPYVNDGTVLGHSAVDFSQGVSRPTSRSLDFMIEGNAFFMVQTPQGVQATRDGRFQLGPDGQLQALDGSPIVGKNGPIKLNPGQGDLSISPDGTLQQGNTVIGQLDLRAYQNPGGLRRMGANRYDPSGMENAPANASVVQGYLEQSTVDVASTLVEMFRINRLFEMSLKVASTIANDLDAKSISDIANAR